MGDSIIFRKGVFDESIRRKWVLDCQNSRLIRLYLSRLLTDSDETNVEIRTAKSTI